MTTPRSLAPPRHAATTSPPRRCHIVLRRRHTVLCHHHAVLCRCCATATPSCATTAPSCIAAALPPPRHLAPLPSATTTVHSHRRRPVPSCAITGAPFALRRRAFSCCCHRFIQADVMGRDKRKGKELVVEPPKKKKARTQKEVEGPTMAADDVTGVGS
jgi:hypothetical protein